MDNKLLISAAVDVRTKAYAPYSGFAVGAALLTKSGDVFTGCNVENISYRLTVCAEQGAVASAIAHGRREFVSIAVVADSKQPIVPCGACRQLLAEFNPALLVIMATTSGEVEEVPLNELLPRPAQGILESKQNV
jgi:cytidine deaminase